MTAVTGIDALAHALESFVCTQRNAVSTMCARAAFDYLEPNFDRVLRAPHDLAARSAMQIGAYLAGMAIESAMLGVCHSCANPLTAHYGLTHGVAIGLMLPHVIRFNAPVAGALCTRNSRGRNGPHERSAGVRGAGGAGVRPRCRRRPPAIVERVQRQRDYPPFAGRRSEPAVDRPVQPAARHRRRYPQALPGRVATP